MPASFLERIFYQLVQDNKIFIYLRLQDEKETLLKSRIREFAALPKLLTDFIKECWELYGQSILKTGCLEYVEANTDLVLMSFRHDIIRRKLIVSGIIPKKYQKRMLDDEETKLKMSNEEFVEKVASNLLPIHKSALERQMRSPHYSILPLIQQDIQENGEFYIVLDLQS